MHFLFTRMVNDKRFPRLYLDKLMIILTLLVLGAGLVFFMYCSAQSLAYPYPLDFGEGQVIDQAVRLAKGQNIYKVNLNDPPYLVANYPPGFMLLVAPFTHIFGPNFWAGRLISSLSALISALLLGVIIWKVSRNKLASMATAGFFIAVPYVLLWAQFSRVDLLGLMFSLAGVALLICLPEKPFILLAGAALFVAAVYTRQTYGFTGPLTVFVLYLIAQRYRSAFIFLTMYSGLGLAILWGMNVITQGGFVFSLITTNLSPWRENSLVEFNCALALTIPLVLMLFTRPWFKPWRVVGLFLLGGTLVGFTISKVGSNVNYLLEWFAGLSLLVGMMIALAGDSGPRLWLSLELLSLSILTFIHLSNAFEIPRLQSHMQSESVAQMERMRAMIRAADGPILADEFIGLLVMEQRPIYYQPFDFTQLSRMGKWDQRLLLDEIAAHKFPLILLTDVQPNITQERWTDEMLAAIHQYYTEEERLGYTIVYR